MQHNNSDLINTMHDLESNNFDEFLKQREEASDAFANGEKWTCHQCRVDRSSLAADAE